MKIYLDIENAISPRTGRKLSIPVAFVESVDLTAWQFLENVLKNLR
ncbi:hypothetical protein B0I21_1169 [Sphingobacterium paludis]|uniref:Uncharacterized protein n=1 Tax=Sphingobacterium paludis TaxID=1476465 RepID=A0A4R7CSG6_9SPHI|nr:hypothetical protein B0I21_1169 [Sphingobacterium paludis]